MFTGFEYILIGIISLYVLGGLLSLLFYKKDLYSNIISNGFSIMASILTLLTSVIFLLNLSVFPEVFSSFGFEKVMEYGFETSLPMIKIQFHFDALSFFFIFIISLLALIVSIYSLGYMKHYFKKRNIGYFGFLYNMFILSMLMVVTSGESFFFLIVWETMSIVSYFLVVYESEKQETQKAGITYVVMTHLGTAFIIVSFILLFQYTGTTDFSLMNPDLIPSGIKNLVFIFFFIGFGMKAGVIPLHIWLPLAHPAAPSNISALMSGVMIKTAIYGMIRMMFDVLGAEFAWWGIVVLILGAISTIFGIAFALMEIDIKKLLAYSSVENIGIILIGLGVSMISLSQQNIIVAALALTASIFHIFNHSIFKSLLFLGAGAVYYSTGTKNMEKLGGLIKRMPWTSLFFLISALSISAIPPLNGFVSEWLTYQALFIKINSSDNLLKMILILIVSILAMAGVLAAFSLIKTFGIAFLAKPRSKQAEEGKEVPKSMLWGMGIPAVLCILAGVFPMVLLKFINTINEELLQLSILKDVKGKLSMITFPVPAIQSQYSPFMLLLISLVLLVTIFYIIAFFKVKTHTRNYGTWDCGYKSLTPVMQYSATGFSKPLRIIFRFLYKPQREFQVIEGQGPYFIKKGKYKVSTAPILQQYIYEPLIKKIINFARRTRFVIQTGSIHTYLIYIFIVMISLLIYFIYS